MYDIFLWTVVVKLIDGGHRLVLVVRLHHTQLYKWELIRPHSEKEWFTVVESLLGINQDDKTSTANPLPTIRTHLFHNPLPIFTWEVQVSAM